MGRGDRFKELVNDMVGQPTPHHGAILPIIHFTKLASPSPRCRSTQYPPHLYLVSFHPNTTVPSHLDTLANCCVNAGRA